MYVIYQVRATRPPDLGLEGSGRRPGQRCAAYSEPRPRRLDRALDRRLLDVFVVVRRNRRDRRAKRVNAFANPSSSAVETEVRPPASGDERTRLFVRHTRGMGSTMNNKMTATGSDLNGLLLACGSAG